jgi:hypothetical protein
VADLERVPCRAHAPAGNREPGGPRRPGRRAATR